MAENPWADIVTEAAAIRPPKTIFRALAEFLEQSTEQKVLGKVNVIRSRGGNVILELNAVVPALGGYTVTLITASHTPMLYPCYLRSDWLTTSQHEEPAADAEDLESKILTMLRTPELKRVVASIYAQVRG